MVEEYNAKEYGKRKNKCSCYGIVLVILTTLFFGVLGAIIGAVISTTIIAALSAVIVLDIVLGILAIIQAILLVCICRKKTCC